MLIEESPACLCIQELQSTKGGQCSIVSGKSIGFEVTLDLNPSSVTGVSSRTGHFPSLSLTCKNGRGHMHCAMVGED